MKRMGWLAAGLAVALVGASAQALLVRSGRQGGHISTGDPRSAVIYPAQSIDIKFDHGLHLREGLECASCHDAKTSTEVSDALVPARTVCMDCHDEAEIPWSWEPGAKSEGALVLPPAHLRFAHRSHVEIDGVTCATCHQGLADTKIATVAHLPAMETCLECHDGARAPDDCKTCHARGRAGTIRTKFPSGQLVPDDHGTQWLEQHRGAARRDPGQCAACHAQSDCLSCHDGSVPPSFHDGNYLAIHPQDAMANSPPCASCHRVERFCRDCHFRAGVTLGQVFPSLTGAFHPPGWTDPGPDHHAQVARKNLASCTGCHAKDDCISCHAFYDGAPRIHPPGWASSRRMRELRDANFGLCLQCHGYGDPTDPIPPP